MSTFIGLAATARCAGGSTAEPMRPYDGAAELEQEAFDSRIWLGIPFRDAMEDGYDVGRQASALGFATFFG